MYTITYCLAKDQDIRNKIFYNVKETKDVYWTYRRIHQTSKTALIQAQTSLEYMLSIFKAAGYAESVPGVSLPPHAYDTPFPTIELAHAAKEERWRAGEERELARRMARVAVGGRR